MEPKTCNMVKSEREDADSDDDVQDSHARSPSPDVKSTAVVKYTSVKCPIGYSKLQCDTDLKMPPSNWLSSATDSYGLQRALSQSAGFSSFKMAHMFPDCVGEVDIVSGAECIKSLLKLPYHPNGVVSMIVHRVENTLLLDDFDIYQYLMKSEWSWLKKFFYEKFLKSISVQDREMYAKNKSRYALQQKSLVSKFLYHSLPSSKMQETGDDDCMRLQYPTLPLTGPTLPEPDIQKAIPQPSFSDHTYNRNVIWTFENLQMLIGTDMPIFGGIDRPCVSLRLRDATQPINVLTGIDYWLDNLMCNVPEVIMCYHLDGIVRKYEPIKTEELPNLKDSTFSPKVIRNVAQNILSFLKSNATKAGHTYWLFKGTNDDVVKLYDLSTLCGSADSSPDENPFTIPVGMLLYRVARNMKTPCQAGHIKVLLENCIKLLPIEKYPHIVASSHFMLANLYIPTNIDPASPNFKAPTGECECGDPSTCRRQEGYDDELNSDSMTFNTTHSPKNVFENTKPNRENMDGIKKEKLISGDVAVHSLSAPSNPFFTPSLPPPIIYGKLEERCQFALKYVKHGLLALKFYTTATYNEQKNHDTSNNLHTDKENPRMAKSFEPIPMGYKTINEKEECVMAQPNRPIILPYKTENKDAESDKNMTTIDTVKTERSSRRKKRDGKNKKKPLPDNNNGVVTDEVENLRQKIDGVILRKDNSIPSWQESSTNDDISWKIHLKLLLYEKACLSCITLAEQYFDNSQYGLSYKNLKFAQKCKIILNSIVNNSGPPEENILKRLGDNLFQFAKYWSKYESEYSSQIALISEEEKFLMDEIDLDLKIYANNSENLNAFDLDFGLPSNQEDAIIKSVKFYDRALKFAPKDKKEGLLRRIASGKNELGVKYMYDAQQQYAIHCNKEEKSEIDDSKEPLYEIFSKKAFTCLTESARIFEQVNDLPNLALLHCNTGRFMRFRAHCNQFTHSPEQRKLYSAAIDHYVRALKILSGENCESVRSLVQWELSSALFTKACLLQDSPPNIPDPASEAAEAIRLALRNCPLAEGPRQCLYQFRAGVLHHRLASLYHNEFRDSTLEPSKLKAAAAISKLNYEQAIKLFLPLEETTIFLTVQLEHIALTEYQANHSPGLKLKYLQAAFELLEQCEPILKLISEKETTESKITNKKDFIANKKKVKIDPDSSKLEDDTDSETGLLVIFEQRLMYILKNLVQFCTQKPTAWKKDNEDIVTFYKNAYTHTLKSMRSTHTNSKEYSKHLYDILITIKEMNKK